MRGRTWTVAAAIRRSDTSGLLGTEGTISCRSKLHVLMHSWAQPGGPASGTVAVCVFQLPQKLKRPATVSATMTVTADGATTSKTVKAKS